MKRIGLAMALAAHATTPAIASSDTAELTDIRAHLMYEQSGTMSDDLTKMEDFVGWNTIIGEGFAKEPASDILIAVVLSSEKEIYDEGLLTIRALSGGKVIGMRQFTGHLVDTKASSFLYLKDATCEGEIMLEASIGEQKRYEKIVLECGE